MEKAACLPASLPLWTRWSSCWDCVCWATPAPCCLSEQLHHLVAHLSSTSILLPTRAASCCLLQQDLHLVAPLDQLDVSRGHLLPSLAARLKIFSWIFRIVSRFPVFLGFPGDFELKRVSHQRPNPSLLSYLLAPMPREYIAPIWKWSAQFQGLPSHFQINSQLDLSPLSVRFPMSWLWPKHTLNDWLQWFTLNWKVTECVPKLASNCVLMFTLGGFPVAFCTTRNSLVTISITWPVWKTKSPFRFTASEERHPGMFACDLSSRVGEPWKYNNIYDNNIIYSYISSRVGEPWKENNPLNTNLPKLSHSGRQINRMCWHICAGNCEFYQEIQLRSGENAIIETFTPRTWNTAMSSK